MSTVMTIPDAPAAPDAATLVAAALGRRRAGASRRPFVLGICGAQGSGKSTLAATLARRFRAEGLNCALVSLDG
ncbi:MAG: hypothetical protein V4574_13510, partial [Pseudomonadota bacterium]